MAADSGMTVCIDLKHGLGFKINVETRVSKVVSSMSSKKEISP